MMKNQKSLIQIVIVILIHHLHLLRHHLLLHLRLLHLRLLMIVKNIISIDTHRLRLLYKQDLLDHKDRVVTMEYKDQLEMMDLLEHKAQQVTMEQWVLMDLQDQLDQLDQ